MAKILLLLLDSLASSFLEAISKQIGYIRNRVILYNTYNILRLVQSLYSKKHVSIKCVNDKVIICIVFI